MIYLATIEPQAWHNDQSIPVDPDGETTWDCTDFIFNASEAYQFDFRRVLIDREISKQGYFVDKRDRLINDPNAPAWTKEWARHSPFTITVKTKEFSDKDKVEIALKALRKVQQALTAFRDKKIYVDPETKMELSLEEIKYCIVNDAVELLTGIPQ